MRLSETIIIYLATGAPFAVSYFLRKRERDRPIKGLLAALVAGVLWPVTALTALVKPYHRSYENPPKDIASQKRQENIQCAKRQLLASVRSLNELAKIPDHIWNKELELAGCVLRESLETYVGLTDTVEDATACYSPTEHSMEFFRIAGRTSDDLALAAKCAHRRNVSRIIKCHSRARIRLTHAIADISEIVGQLKSANELINGRLSLETVELFKHAINLLSLMGDREAAMKIAGLANQERLRFRDKAREETRVESLYKTGDELCTANTSRPSQVPLAREVTLAQG